MDIRKEDLPRETLAKLVTAPLGGLIVASFRQGATVFHGRMWHRRYLPSARVTMDAPGSYCASTSRQSPRHKRKGRTRDSAAAEPKKMAKLVVSDSQAPASIVTTKSSVQRCIDEIESAQIAASSKDLCSLQIYAKRLVETIDRAILAAYQREKEQAVGQAASLVTRELEKVRREQVDGQRAADAEIMKLRDEKATVEAIAAAERIKWAVCHQDVAPSADRSKLEDEISCFFRYLSSS